MARTVTQIIDDMDAEQALQTSLSGLNSPSQTALYTMWKYIVAVCQNILEQLWDLKKAEIEAVVATAPVGSDYWLQKKVLEFQYDAIIPQVLTLDTDTLAVSYDPINTAYQIISRCSVKTTGVRIATIKVATGEPPAALSAPQLAALQSYVTSGGDGTYNGRGVGLGFAGTQWIISSTASDKIWIEAEITYDGQYAGTISATVIEAIKDYLANISFDGEFKILTLIDYIQNVPGVVDIMLENVAIRADATLFANRTYLVNSFTEVFTKYPTFAGYVVEETTINEDLASTLTFTSI